MAIDESFQNDPSPLIALIGTTRAGKSVFTAALAKYLERKLDGVWLFPKEGRPKSTYAQIEEWWNTLQGGNWLPATPPGTLIELQWELRIEDKKIPLRMFDYAGENLTDLFSGKKDEATGAAMEFFEKVRTIFENASVLLVLINLETFIVKDAASASEHKDTLIRAISSFLEKRKHKRRSSRVCFVFTAYDQFKSVILSKYGSVMKFLDQEIPPLYYAILDEQSKVEVLEVAAVGETEHRVNPHDGRTILSPKPGFQTQGFEKLVKWLVESVSEAKIKIDQENEQKKEDQKNDQFLEQIEKEWISISDSDQIAQVDRFLNMAQKKFPHDKRPNLENLQSKQLVIINKATNLRDKISEKINEKTWKNIRIIVTLVSITIPSIMWGRVALKGIISAYEKKQLAEEERLRFPIPQVNEKVKYGFFCIKGIFGGCTEHKLTATIPIINKGGSGNITAKISVGNYSNSVKKFFNEGESLNIDVTVSNLPNHTVEKLNYSVEASK